MIKTQKKVRKMNSVEAYACACSAYICSCGCSCNPSSLSSGARSAGQSAQSTVNNGMAVSTQYS